MKIGGTAGIYFYAAAQSRAKKEKENPVNGFPAGLTKEREGKKDSFEKGQTSEREEAESGASVPGAEKAARYAYKRQTIREMSQKEWETLLKKTDVGIKEGQETSRLHKKKMEELAEEKRMDKKSHLQEMLNGTERKTVPYAHMANEYGMIEYKGVIFQCDYEAGAICLGDMSNEKNVLTIPLSEGGSLKVNRDNIEQLGKAIGMFSPEDVNRILRAIAQDAKVRQVKQELDEDSESIGDSATEHLDEEARKNPKESNQITI